MSVVVPGWVVAREREAMVDRQIGLAKYFNQQLEAIDDRMELVWVKENADGPGLVPGRWHVKRRNDPPAPDTYIPICAPGGEYREPGEDVLDELRRRDLRNDTTRREIMSRSERREQSRQRDKEREREARQADIAQNIKAIESPSVLFTGGKDGAS